MLNHGISYVNKYSKFNRLFSYYGLLTGYKLHCGSISWGTKSSKSKVEE